jgi:hypothetical protein
MSDDEPGPTGWYGVITFDEGALPVVVEGLVNQVLPGKVRLHLREGVHNGRPVVEFRVGGLPVDAWSTGEQLIWRYLTSLSGLGLVNVGEVLAWFRSEPQVLGLLAGTMQAAMFFPPVEAHG